MADQPPFDAIEKELPLPRVVNDVEAALPSEQDHD
jgi:hypothetical protein